MQEIEKFEELAKNINEVEENYNKCRVVASTKLGEIKTKFIEQKKKLKALLESNNMLAEEPAPASNQENM